MKITLKNVASIRKGTVQIDEGKINVLYGANGIGKTTLIKVLKEIIEGTFDQNKETFKPLFNLNAIPEANIDKRNFSNILIFNRDYVDNYLYKDDLANNSYALIAKTSDFEKQIQSINEILDKAKQAANSSILNSLIADFDNVDTAIKFKENKKGIAKFVVNLSSKIGKACKDCVKKEIKLTENLSRYSAFKGILNWIDWVKSGIEIVDKSNETVCPFCGKNLTDQELDDVKYITSLGTTKSFQDNEKARKQLLSLNKYSNTNIQAVISNFCESKDSISNIDASGLKNALDTIRSELQKIKDIRSIAPISASDVERSTLINRFETAKINLDVFDGSSNELSAALNAYNQALLDLKSKASELLRELGKLNSSKKALVNKFKNTINQFLQLAGIPYETYVDMRDDMAFTHLRYKGSSNDIIDTKHTLSYGEFNAIALCLFALEATKKEKSLIVLDDPISSYDSEKRAAILISLFCDEKTGLCLKGRTIIVLTHDFETLVPFFKWSKLNDGNFVSAWHISSKSGELSQEFVNASSIKNTAVLEKECAVDSSLPLIVRIVHLRRYYQLIDCDGDEYQYLSCLTHDDSNHEVPSYKQDNQFTPMSEDTIKKVENEFSTMLGKGNFTFWKDKIGKTPELIETYEQESNKYNKLIIARQIISNQFKKQPEEELVKIYITETYHVDAEHIFGFENQFDNVPDYIMAFCDEIIKDIKKSLENQ